MVRHCTRRISSDARRIGSTCARIIPTDEPKMMRLSESKIFYNKQKCLFARTISEETRKTERL
jgi:hypothetical protein